ncbi:MAG: GNAT family N-acetyltransferase, partial [Armatimonadetes bacterium]|nr:GNAT family N-acetyltransferase [Armatimonadota bacterium]
EHRGRGLGRALVLSVLRRLREVGVASATLDTDDFRLPAIRLYLALGFRPELTHESHAERWRDVRRELGPEGKEVGT